MLSDGACDVWDRRVEILEDVRDDLLDHIEDKYIDLVYNDERRGGRHGALRNILKWSCRSIGPLFVVNPSGRGKDKKARKKRPKLSDAEKAKRAEEKAERDRKKLKTGKISDAFNKRKESDEEVDETDTATPMQLDADATEDDTEEDGRKMPSVEVDVNGDEPPSNGPSNEPDRILTEDTNFTLKSVVNPSPVIPSIDDDDGEGGGGDGDGDDDFDFDFDFDDDEDDDDVGDGTPKRKRKKRTDCQWLFMVALQKRLRFETNEKGVTGVNVIGALDKPWLLEFLKENNYWIRRESAVHIAEKLVKCNHMEKKDVGLGAYYCDVKVWMPERQHDQRALPPCPNCQSNRDVSRHGWPDAHVGRSFVGLNKTQYCMGPRYKCTRCKEHREALKVAAESASSPEAEIIPYKSIKYTFMGWNAGTLPFIHRGLGDEFPAVLTHKSGLAKEWVSMLRPLFDGGMRSEAIANLILEQHSLEHARLWTLHERDIEAKLADIEAKLAEPNSDAVNSNSDPPEMFSTFDDR